MPTQRSSLPSNRRSTSHPRLVVRTNGAVPQQTSDTNWADLCAEVIAEFPAIEPGDVIEEIARARSATELFGLDNAERIRATGTIARNNLRLTSGEADLARLDPETHSRRKHSE
jgi:hypothetical protein